MRGVDVRVHVGDADRSAAEALCSAAGSLRRQLEAHRPHGLLPGVERTIATIFLEVGLSALCEKDTPRGFESATRLVEALGKAACSLCQIAAGIEAAAPLPARLSGLPTRSAITPTRTSP
jgi:hypothetical protein